MKRILVIISFVIALFPLKIKAQDVVSTTEQFIADIFEQYSQESEDEIDYDTFFEELMVVAQNPINLNHTTRQELEQLPFLSDTQIENILAYVYKMGELQTIYELQLIEGLDMTDIRRMVPFVKIGKANENGKKFYLMDLIKYGKNELLSRIDKGVETKEGYQYTPEEDTEDATKKYKGNSIYNSLKYRFQFKDRVLAGFTAEKDAGEEFVGKQLKGYDFYSAYAQLKDLGKIKTIVAGDFRANFGQGLVLRPEFGMGKSSYVLNVSPRNSGLKKYSSTDEYNFFRGAGATVRLGRFDISAFYSNKMIDGDTTNNAFSSIYKTGLHRTDNEIEKKHTVNQQVMGGNTTFTYSNMQVGFTAVHTLLSCNLVPEKSVYNYHYFSGNKQTSAGINYRMRMWKLNFFGETALSQNGALATLNGCTVNPISNVSLALLHRYYSPEYDTFYATAFAETGRINNENGLYMGVEVRPVRRWKIAAYADSYKFEWPKFGVDAPSIGKDYLVQTDFGANRNLNMFWRLKYEEKQVNISNTQATMPTLGALQKTSMRYQLNYTFGNFKFKNVVEGNLAKKGETKTTYGLIVSQDVSYAFGTLPLSVDVRLQYFDAENYENRMYSFEKDVLYAFSIPMYYGLGSRYYINLAYEPSDRLKIWFKIAQTTYADERETLSSGYETIAGNRKTDIRLLVKWSF